MNSKRFHPPTEEHRMKQKPDEEEPISRRLVSQKSNNFTAPISFLFCLFVFLQISFLSFSRKGRVKFSSDFA